MLRLRYQLAQTLCAVGGATDSIFPQVEALLLSDVDYQRALEFVGSRKDMDRYRSMVDFLFCEIFTQYRYACFKYYKGKGRLLRYMITIEQWFFFNNVLLKALEIAYQRFTEKRATSWIAFRKEVLGQVA